MASFNLTGPTFPNGTSIGAYPETNWNTGQLPPSGSAPGSATATATMTSGVAAFSGLADNTRYYAGAQVNSVWRYVRFYTGVAASAGGTVGSAQPTRIDQGGNTGAAVTITVPDDVWDVWHVGNILNAATVTYTISGFPSGEAARVKIIGVQDAAGGRAVAVDDGSGAVAVSGISTAASGPFEINVDWDGTHSTAYAVGGTQDATTAVKGIVQLAGDLAGTAALPTIKSSVALGGNPTTTTQSASNNSTRIATTAYVDTAVSAGGGGGISAAKAWKPANTVSESFPRWSGFSAYTIASARIYGSGGHYLASGDTVTSIAFHSGGTALSSGTNQWFALINSDTGALLGITADDTSTAWAANSFKNLNLTTPYVASSAIRVTACICVVATTPPNLQGSIANGVALILDLTPRMSWRSSGFAFSNPASMPNPMTAFDSNTVLTTPYSQLR
jgi:hypothetical protein